MTLRILRLLVIPALAGVVLCMSSCTNSKEAQKRKLMGEDDISGLSWSRPESWEGGTGFGGLGGAAGQGL